MGDTETVHLLLEWEDQRTGGHRREAAFISVIAHLFVIILFLVEPKFFTSFKRTLGVVETPPQPRRQLTYLAAAPDDQQVKIPQPNAVPSDKNRIARPGLELPPVPKAEPKPAEKPGKSPEPEKPLLAQAGPPNLPPAAVEKPAQPQAPPLQLGDVKQEQPKLAMPPASPGRALEDTLRGMAKNRGGGQAVGDEGGGPGVTPRSPAAVGEARILSDTQGVDFDPYLRRVVADIRRNWYAVMPEIARLGRRGRVIVVFEIQRDGGVPKLYLVSTSGFEPLDRAALAGISASVPFPQLPPEFTGPLIRLQVTFLYNMFVAQ